jgi:hypothetical protein
MASPAMIHPQRQIGDMDCVMACLSAILLKPYEEVVEAAKKVDPAALEVGLTPTESKRVARLLGCQLTSHRVVKAEREGCVTPDDLESLTGILYVRRGRTWCHAVVLFNGSVYNPANGMLYLPDVYFASIKCHPYWVLLP